MSPVFDSGATLGTAAAQRLARLDAECEIGPGLSEAEFERVERDYNIDFSDDHRAFLAAGLPYRTEPYVSDEYTWYAWVWPWPDWRNGDPDRLRQHIEQPVRQALDTITTSRVWPPAWGPRPADDAEARHVARHRLAQAPPMIPVYGHRYLPGGSGTYGFPVLSIWETTDIVVYGNNLDDYIEHEFGGGERGSTDGSGTAKAVPFWSDFAELRGS